MDSTLDTLTTAQLSEAVTFKTEQLAKLWKDAGPNIDLHQVYELSGSTHERLEQMHAMEEDLNRYKAQLDVRRTIDQQADAARMRVEHQAHQLRVAQGPPPAAAIQSNRVGDLYVQSATYANWKASGGDRWMGSMRFDDVDVRSLMNRPGSVRADLFYTGDGFDPPTMRTGDIVPIGAPPIEFIDVVPQLETTQDVVAYMEQTEWDRSNVAPTAEQNSYTASASDAIGEAAITYTEREAPIRWVPVFLPVSQMQLEDVPAIQGELNVSLGQMIRATVSSQMLTGDGVAPNLQGTLGLTNLPTVARGSDPGPDALLTAISNIRTNSAGRERAEPTAIIMHPSNWRNIRTLTTSDGLYLWGSPATPGASTIWGMPVVETPEITLGTALVGDFVRFARLYVRRGLTVETSDSHGTMFTRGQLAIRASMRVAMVHRRINAFHTVSGMQ